MLKRIDHILSSQASPQKWTELLDKHTSPFDRLPDWLPSFSQLVVSLFSAITGFQLAAQSKIIPFHLIFPLPFLTSGV